MRLAAAKRRQHERRESRAAAAAAAAAAAVARPLSPSRATCAGGAALARDHVAQAALVGERIKDHRRDRSCRYPSTTPRTASSSKTARCVACHPAIDADEPRRGVPQHDVRPACVEQCAADVGDRGDERRRSCPERGQLQRQRDDPIARGPNTAASNSCTLRAGRTGTPCQHRRR